MPFRTAIASFVALLSLVINDVPVMAASSQAGVMMRGGFRG